jgi:uncharacterized protein
MRKWTNDTLFLRRVSRFGDSAQAQVDVAQSPHAKRVAGEAKTLRGSSRHFFPRRVSRYFFAESPFSELCACTNGGAQSPEAETLRRSRRQLNILQYFLPAIPRRVSRFGDSAQARVDVTQSPHAKHVAGEAKTLRGSSLHFFLRRVSRFGVSAQTRVDMAHSPHAKHVAGEAETLRGSNFLKHLITPSVVRAPTNHLHFILLCLFFLSAFSTLSQDVPKDEIKVITRSYGDSIVVRWAPTTPVSWQLLNQYGYRVERFIIVRDSVVLQDKRQTTLTAQAYKPAPLEQWKTDALKEELVAVAAQAIYGSSFQLTNVKTSSVMDVVNKSRELESRFSFHLFAADLSPRAASLSALRWVDKDVKRNEKYLYRVYSLVPENNLKIDFGYAYQSAKDKLTLTEPRSPTAVPGDRGVKIEWDPNYLRDVYTAYYLEKSVDGGKTFSLARKLPIVPVANAGEGFQQIIVGDSLANNDDEFFYRIRGTNPFGDKGPYSKPVAVKGISSVKGNVSWANYTITPQNTVVLRWKFSPAWEKEVEGFSIERATKESGPYKIITVKSLPAQTREYEDKVALPVNYYRIITSGKSKQKLSSTPYLVQLEDSIPPATPLGLKAVVDSLGIASINWQANKENDLLGYHVYRSNFKSSEFTRITTAPLINPNFIDTLNLHTLTSKAYYKVMAIDRRFNPSPQSEAFELARPDRIPPVPPVITTVKSTKDGVLICWNNSSSEDVANHSLYRRQNEASPWVLVKIFAKTDSCFIDNPDKKTAYQYKIVAEDLAKLTASSQLFNAKVLETGAHPPITKIKSTVDRTEKKIKLTWTYSEPNVVKYLVYRAEEGDQLSLYGTILGSAAGFADGQLTINSTYLYRVKAVFKDGRESPFSEAVEVKF